MNDRYKFRAWDKTENAYIEDAQFTYDDGCEGGAGSFRHYSFRDLLEDKNCIVEQCTGLKDKNGRLIYDNDFIRAINQDTKDKPDLQIGHIWVDEMGCRWIKFKTEELSWNDFCSLIDYDGTLTIEVIGNIHENADLLEVNND